LMELLQDVPHGHVLFTSRRVDWPIALADLTLERFPVDVSVEFLRRRTFAWNAGRDDAAADLARELDGSPLLLEQAAAYLETRRISFEAYLLQLQAADPGPSLFDETAEYREPLPETWAISEAQLAPAARAILRIASFFAREPLPRDLFERRPELIREAAALLAADGAAPLEPNASKVGLEQLARLALIELTLSSVSWRQSLRPARDTIPPAQRDEWLGFALRLFEAVLGDAVQLESLQPHALSLLEATDDFSQLPAAARLYSELGSFLAAKGRFHEAEPLLRRALVLHEEAYASDDPALPSHLQRLAEVLIAMSRTEEAEPFTDRARRQALADVQGHA
jgi:tetratricopeptide (TPR) repeat protein